MNTDEQPPVGPTINRRPPSLAQLARKELRETLRDRRTLMTLLLMPLLVYPLLSLGFRSFVATSALPSDDDSFVRYRIGVNSSLNDEQLRIWFEEIENIAVAAQTIDDASGRSFETVDTTDPHRRRVEAPFSQQRWLEFKRNRNAAIVLMEQDELDLFVEINAPVGDGHGKPIWELTFDPSVPISRNAARLVREHLELMNRSDLQRRLAAATGDASALVHIEQHPVQLQLETGQGPNLAAIIPLILVLMTITGAVYPAIDLTAGERERGTLETLIAAPIPRMKILVAKMTAVLTVSILTAVLNLTGMLGTIWAFGLERTLLGPQSLTLTMVAQVLGLLVLFAMFFSAIMLVITSYARSFKEAQAYLIPLILLSLGPGLLTLTPGMELSGPWAVAPMVNILLLARDVLQGQLAWVPAGVAIISTAIYAVAAVALAASIFGSDSILYGGPASWSEMFARPAQVQPAATPQVVLFCLLLLFPLNFVLIGILSRIETTIGIRLVWMAAFTAFAFFVVPSLVAWHQRIDWRSGFGWRNSRPIFVVAALVLGVSLWPLVMSLLAGWQQFTSWFAGEDAARAWAERLVEFSRGHVERFREAPIGLIVMAFSIVPAFCEEWFFRGMLLRSLLRVRHPSAAIVFSALAFGAFHTLAGGIAMFDRFATTTLVGLVLGWIAYRTKSVLPGMVLHAVHNALVFGLAYFQRELAALPGFPQEDEPVPVSWVTVAVFVSVATLLIIGRARSGDVAGETALPRRSGMNG